MMPPASSFHALFARNLTTAPGKTFLVDSDRSVTFAQTDEQVRRLAAELLARGLQEGDRVVIQLRKGIAEVVCMLAVSRIGAIVVNIGTAWTAEQMRFVAEDCGAALLICEPRMIFLLVADDVDPNRLMSPPEIKMVADAPIGGDDVPASARADADLAAIIYTSGSTGKPKGVMLSHANIVTGACSVADYLGLTAADRLLSVLPYCFDYGLNQLTTMMLVGGTVVHQPITLASEVVGAIHKHAVTGLAAVPPLWTQIVRLLDLAPVDFPALRFITNSGGKIPLDTLRRMPGLFPRTQIFLMYGLTEAFRSTYLPPDMFARKMGAIGRAVPHAQVFVIRHGIGIAGPGEMGELVHRGPLVSQGYWDRPEATSQKIRPCPELKELIGDEPVVYSGDIVRVDDDGDLWFVGRNDALIKTSGYRVSPDDVEDLVFGSGMAADVVAFGVEDALLGQSIHVAISLLPGATPDQVRAHCRKVMPPYMVPQSIHVWPVAMPRTASGKLARQAVIRGCPGVSAQPVHPDLQGANCNATH